MGHYLTTTKSTSSFPSQYCKAVVDAIKIVCKRDEYNHCAWQQDVLNSTTIYQIAEIFGIDLHSEIGTDLNQRIYFSFNEVYASCAFPSIAKAIAPFMSDGITEGISEYGNWKVEFKDKQVTITS